MAQATVSDTTPLTTVVGIFSNDRKAVEAMRSLDAAGFDADRVQLTDVDPSRAAEIGGTTYALEGGLVGLIAGAVIAAGFAAWGDLATDPVGLVIGAIGVVGGMTAIGFVVGRATRGAIVSVQCTDDECDLAAQMLDGAGAREVRDEAGPEAV
jgi:hypothetical protein